MAKAVTTNFSKLSEAIRRAEKKAPAATAKKVTAIALDLSGRSARLSPVDTGDLRNNCTAQVNGTTVFEKQRPAASPFPASRAEAVVGYSLPYALRQHEELGYRHPKGGQAKFLEQPLLEKEKDYISLLASIPDEVMK